jgi:hypothetical protein
MTDPRSSESGTWHVLADVADLVERNCRLAKRFAQAFSDAGFSVLNDVVLNQVLVSFDDADVERSIEAILRSARS